MAISGYKAPHQPTTLYSDQQLEFAEFGAEKSAFFSSEAPQQEPGEFLVPVSHTRPYHAVSECSGGGGWDLVLWMGCIVLDLNVVPT